MNPQVGIGFPFAPLRIGPDGLVLELCGTMLKVAPVATKKRFFQFLKFHPSRKANRHLSETTLPWLHGPCLPCLVGLADLLVFRLFARGNTLVCPYTIIIVELAQTVGRVLEVLETQRVGTATF